MQDWQSLDIVNHRPPPALLENEATAGALSPGPACAHTTACHWGRWPGLQGAVLRAGCLHGKEWGTLASEAPLCSLSGWLEALGTQPWPSVTLSRACPHGPPPCPRAGWAWTCLGSTSFASNPGLALGRLCFLLPPILQAQVQEARGWRVIPVIMALSGARIGGQAEPQLCHLH